MADITTRIPDCDDCEGERGERGKRGHRGHRGHDGDTGPTGPTGDMGLNAADPARTLFVAQSWSTPVDPSTHFTSIAAAYAASVALNPTAADPVGIIVYPGTYPDPVTVVSNVHLTGANQQRSVNVTGLVTWTPSAGVNAPQANDPEYWNFAFMSMLGGIVINSSAKTTSECFPICRGCILFGASYTGTGTIIDAAIILASVLQPGVYTFNNWGGLTGGMMNFYATRTRAMTFSGSTNFNMAGGISLATLTCNQTGAGRITGTAMQGATAVSVAAGSSVVISGGTLFGNVVVAAGGTADVRMTNVNGDAKLVGPGKINRTTWIGTAGPTVAGVPLMVALTPPFPDALYNVSLQLILGPGNAGVTVTLKTDTDFTITDAVGGNTFDFTVIHD